MLKIKKYGNKKETIRLARQDCYSKAFDIPLLTATGMDSCDNSQNRDQNAL